MITYKKQERYHKWLAHNNYTEFKGNMYVFNIFKTNKKPSKSTLEPYGISTRNNWLRLY